MKIKRIIIIATILALPTLAALAGSGKDSKDNISWFSGNYKQALNQAKKENKPILVDFFTDWCVYCKKMDKEVFPKAEVGQAMTHYVAFRVDAEKGEGIELAKKFKVSGYPTFIMIDTTGREIDRIPGYVDAKEFVQIANDYRQGINTLASLVKRVQVNGGDMEARAKLLVKYLERGDNKKAKPHVSFLLKKDPDFSNSHTASALSGGLELAATDVQLLLEEGKDDEADAAFARMEHYSDLLLKHYPSSMEAYSVYSTRIRVARSEEDDATVLNLYRTWAEAFPDDTGALNGYAWTTTELGKELGKGLQAVQRAVELAPNDPMILDTLAEIHWKMGQSEKAIVVIKKAIKLEPKDDYYQGQLDKFLGKTEG